jgi:hypothetical protein
LLAATVAIPAASAFEARGGFQMEVAGSVHGLAESLCLRTSYVVISTLD